MDLDIDSGSTPKRGVVVEMRLENTVDVRGV